MGATTFSPPGRPDRTFAVAVAIVALFGAAQIIAVGAHYAGKWRAARDASQALVVTAQPAVATPAAAPTEAPATSGVQTAPAPPVTAQAPPFAFGRSAQGI